VFVGPAVISNLFRPWILARLSAELAAAVLVLVGLVVGWRVLRAFRIERTSEGQLVIERRAELVAALVEVALGATIVGLAIALLGADRMKASIRGAMCAWGVLDASPWGFRSLAVSAIAAIGCAAWITMHRLDLRLRAPTLTRAKFAALFAVGPLVLLDFACALTYALDLDLRVVASCCSAGLDEARALASQDAGAGPRQLAAVAFVGSASGAVVASAWVRLRPSAQAAIPAAVASLVAGAASVPAVVWWVAPHVYETPAHLCPFCLLSGDVLGLGWPLCGALFAGTALGVGVGLTGALERASGEPETARRLLAKLGGASAFAWALALALALLPIVRWTIVSGGASLWGAGS
jgi:hypothetical protein